MLIDTHTHLYDEKFCGDRDEMILRAIESGVTKLYLPNCDSHTISPMLELEKKYPSQCFAMMGVHPCYIQKNYLDELKIAEDWLSRRSFAAVGEIGLDYYWDITFKEEQKIAFRTQIEWSLHYGLPIVIHMRESTKDTLDIVKEYVSKGVRGVFHCFTGSYETAKQIIDMGFYLGIGGVLTYKNSGLQEVVKNLDLSYLVLETDAPYLTPAPFRGKRNESAYINYVAERLSELKNCSLEEIKNITNKNAENLFKVN